MDTEKTDRRARRTKTILRSTLTSMLQDKELKEISVSELTQKADVNRGTFYLHYKDIFDLFEQTENETVEQFTSIIDKFKHKNTVDLVSIMLELFKYISENADIFRAILKTKDSVFLDRIIEMYRPKNKEEWSSLFTDGKSQYYEYYYMFLTSGCIAMIRSWFARGMLESSEQMAALAQKLMTNCTRDLS